MKVLTVKGAYGRRYDDGNEVLLDWEAGLDFKIVYPDGPYCSIRDLEKIKADGYTHIRFVQGRKELLFVELH